MAFQAPFDIMDYARMRMTAEAQQQQQQQAQAARNQELLMNGLQMIGGAVGDYMDKKNQAAAMDKGVGMMSDIGVIKPDIRDSFMNLDRSQKPLVWDLLRQSMFAPYAAGQSASAQAQAWDQYRNNGGGQRPGNQYGYVYQGP
jgi:hypothetical protein